jgi:hypothetical protein
MENFRKELVEHIKKNFEKGYDAESLKYALLRQGYSKIEVANALEKAKKELEDKNEKNSEKPKIKYEIYGENNKPIREPFWRKIFRKKNK